MIELKEVPSGIRGLNEKLESFLLVQEIARSY